MAIIFKLFALNYFLLNLIHAEDTRYIPRNGINVNLNASSLLGTFKTKMKYKCLSECNKLDSCYSCVYERNSENCILLDTVASLSNRLSDLNAIYFIKDKCKPGWQKLNHLCLLYHSSISRPWTEARDYCISLGTILLNPRSQSEFDLLSNNYLNGKITIGGFAGGYKSGNDFYWVDGRLMNMSLSWFWKVPFSTCLYIVGCKPDGFTTLNGNPCNQPGFSFDSWSCGGLTTLTCQYDL